MKNRLRFDLTLLSTHRQFLYGFAALWIVLFHCLFPMPDHAVLAPLRWAREHGNCGVDVLTLLSAMGLYRSLRKDERVLPFYGRRIVKVFLPSFIVIAVVYGMTFTGTGQYLKKLLIMPYWFGVGTLWYVPFILLMYLAYPLVYKLQKRSEKLPWVLLALSVVFLYALKTFAPMDVLNYYERPVSRIPVFLVGCILAPMIDRKETVSFWWMPAALVIYVLLEAGSSWLLSRGILADLLAFWPLNRIAYIFLSAFLVMALSYVAKWMARGPVRRAGYRCMAFMGGISLELYLIYSRVYGYLYRLAVYSEGQDSLFKLEVFNFIVTVLLSVMLQSLCETLSKRFLKISIPVEPEIK